MKVTKQVAIIEPGADDAESPNGTFHVVLSTPSKDREGEEVKSEEWEQPLPDHITFDMDHGMSVASTVGSGAPSIEADGTLHVRGTYSSRPLAQEVRGLVNEGHIKTTSVAFLRKTATDTKSGAKATKRELLNGAFVAIPSNKEAVVLSSKGATVELDDAELEQIAKAGRRHSSQDMSLIQSIHDAAVSLGAVPASVADPASATSKQLGYKAVTGSYEDRQQALTDAVDAMYAVDDGDGDNDARIWTYTRATFDDRVVYHVSGSADDNGDWQATYTVNEDGTVTLGTPERVNLTEQITPVNTENDGSAAAEKSAAEHAADHSAAAEHTDSASQEIAVRAAGIRARAALASLEGENHG